MRKATKVLLGVAGVIVGLLLAIRFIGSPIATSFANKRLGAMPQFTGRVEAVQLALWRGTITVQGLRLTDRAHPDDGPVIKVERAMLSLALAPLFKGRVGGHGLVERAEVVMVKRAETAEDEKQKAERLAKPVVRGWQEVLQKEFPLEITEMEVRDSRVRFEDRSDPQTVSVELDQIQFKATDFLNREKGGSEGALPSSVHLDARLGGTGKLRVDARADPAEAQPRFEATLELKGLSLVPLHDFLVRYALIDVSAGEFEMYSEVKAAGGSYDGYVKPFFKDLKFKAVPDPEKSLIQRAATKVAASVSEMLKNEEGNVATRAPFQGDFAHNEVDVWTTLENLLRNAFIEALRAGLEGQKPE